MEPPKDPEIYLNDNFLLKDKVSFNGYTPYEIINKHTNYIETLKDSCKSHDKKYEILVNEQVTILTLLDNYEKEIRRYREENKFLHKEFLGVKKELSDIKEKLSNIEK